MVLVAGRVTWNRRAGLFLGQADIPCPVGPREARSDPFPDLSAQEALSVWWPRQWTRPPYVCGSTALKRRPITASGGINWR